MKLTKTQEVECVNVNYFEFTIKNVSVTIFSFEIWSIERRKISEVDWAITGQSGCSLPDRLHALYREGTVGREPGI